MKKGDLLFVYGTLRKGERADLSLRPYADFVGVDCINGDIFDLGAYPGLVSDGELGFDPNLAVVFGDVFRLGNDELSVMLDAYEGYPYLYNRKQVEAKSGHIVWVYTYQHETAADQHIPSGDWKARSPIPYVFHTELGQRTAS